MANRRVGGVFAVFFVILMASLPCHSADVVLIRSAGDLSSEERELELATRFYGVNLRVVTAGDSNAGYVLRAVRQKATVAAAIEANALALVNREALLQALHRGPGNSVPLLVFGLTPETQRTLLSAWSGGAAVGVNRLVGTPDLHYTVRRAAGITQQLTDLAVPFRGTDTFYFALPKDLAADEIMTVGGENKAVPIFIRIDLHQQQVFLLCKNGSEGDSAVEWTAENMATEFAAIAPVMMFVKYGAGERGWHTLHHYANLTIDDPWLREPYGHLSYKGLLREMEKHNFHTSIAFPAWNYDRSEPDVVSLVRSHPERFSICIHGNNHDHKEFDDLESTPLSSQVADLKQSLARMKQFQTLTGIPYDSVFVFPHSIGTESILGQLKRYNFLATINVSNVPMDRVRPAEPLFALRPVTLAFGDFPSINRYPAGMEKPNSFISINAFLDNPLLFYAHHDLFERGINAFDGMADSVNTLAPGTQWRGVGDIVRHLYLVKQRDDTGYDVLTFANTFDLENTWGRKVVFYVNRREVNPPLITSVTVDGQHYPFQLLGGYLRLSVPVPVGGVRRVVIEYKNDLDTASISTSSDSLRVYVLRRVSDYRDVTLSKYYVGRAFTAYYYKHEVTPGLLIACGCAVLLFLAGGTWAVLLIVKRRIHGAKTAGAFQDDKVGEGQRLERPPVEHSPAGVGRAASGIQFTKMTKYVVITPVRDEQRFIEATVASVQGQTIRPAKWIIVDDGSTDRTGEIIDRHAAQFPWISVVHRRNRGFRKAGGGVMEAFYDGYNTLHFDDWDFIVKLDGDLTLSPDYFEKCFEHFERDPKLGIGGGDIYHECGGEHKVEANPKFHVRGATKIYRRGCWEAIGGLWKAPGWDTIDEVKANMLGWKSYSFGELRVIHHRLTGTAEGVLRDRIKHGVACYISGYHPLFLVASCVSRLTQKPYVSGSVAICYGFLKGYWNRIPRVNDRRLIKYLRTQQLRRLCGLDTIWR